MSNSMVAPHLLAYCERAGDPGLWAEPLNFVTNGLFLLFGWFAWQLLRDQQQHTWRQKGDIWGLAIALFLIGIGSGLWHSWAAPGWTVIVDTIPIYIFINIYIFSLWRRLAGLRWGWIIAIWVGFTAINTVVQQGFSSPFIDLLLAPLFWFITVWTFAIYGMLNAFDLLAQTAPSNDIFAGSILYIPTLLFMSFSGLYLIVTKRPHGLAMLSLGGLFFISLTFRTIDTLLCPTFPLGTHFIWHCLNAILLYRLIRLLVLKPATT